MPIRFLRAVSAAARSVIARIAGVHPDSFEAQYLRLVRKVLEEGAIQHNRTGTDAISLHGAFVRFDLQKGFPALTTKRLAFKSVLGLCGFLRASQDAKAFRALGCKVWDQNANENAQWLANPWRDGADHLGPVYGVQWRAFPAFKLVDLDAPRGAEREADAQAAGFRRLTVIEEITDEGKWRQAVMFKEIDQLKGCLETLLTNPADRRMVFHGWNPAVLDAVALPACHILYVLSANVATRELSLSVTMRSTDVGLGLPFNAASSAALLHLIARLTGFKPKWLSITMADAHIYENHMPMVQEQLHRIPKRPPNLVISDRVPAFEKTGRFEPEWLERVEPGDFSLDGYKHHAPLTAPMAV
jgi:thymidylate synthase